MPKRARKKIITSLLALILVLISVFGLAVVTQKMESQAGMAMVGCPFVVQDAGFCPMRVADHLASWRQLFMAEPGVVFVLLALVAVVSFLARDKTEESRFFLFWRRWRQGGHIRKLFDDLLRSLARGIIQPKIYVIYAN